MSGDHRQKLRRVFMEVVELPEAARSEALDAACGHDAALRAEVEALLAADSEATRFLSDAPAVAGRSSAGELPGERPGAWIGPYRLVELIGEGGFGWVFKAEQEKPVSRQVALKIIKLGMDTRQVVARFEAERQALVILEHPNIARVLDAGATETGRPYFVMELVTGEPITTSCDRHKRSIRERLELLAAVCDAVQHAHTKGIIHRDLKPSNILVTELDGRPAPKVIDFGIAKATAARLSDNPAVTEERQLIGTPEYMSPEQAAGSLDIDTRTDVYSLGVLAYELVTGSTPFEASQLRSGSLDQMRRIIQELDPPKPSTRLVRAEALASTAVTRSIDPKRLGSQVRGELDWLVMKAIEKDRARRYESAGAMAEDIRRYLRGDALVAAPPSTVYRVGKFVRRHRVGAVAASAVAAALLAGGGVSAWQARVAQRERDGARLEAARATATNDFLERMFLAADPQAGGSRELTVAQLLEKASASADKTLMDQPLVEAHARALLGSTFRSLGKVDEAARELERARVLQEQAGETRTIFMAGTYRKIGIMLMDRRQTREALSYFQRAKTIILEDWPDRTEECVQSHLDIAWAHLDLAEFADCEHSLDQAEVLAAALSDPARSAEKRASIAGMRGRLIKAWKNDQATAEALAEREVSLWRQAGKPAPLADALNNLAVMRMEGGKLDEALSLYKEALDISRVELGDTHPRIATYLENCGNVYFRKKQLDDAQSMLDQALVIREAAFGADSMIVARTRFNNGALATERGDFARGLELAEASVASFRKSPGERSPEFASALYVRAICMRGKGDLGAAIDGLKSALTVLDEVTAPAAPQRLRCLQGLTATLCLKGQTEEANRTAHLALDILDAGNPGNAKWIKIFEDLLADCRPASNP